MIKSPRRFLDHPSIIYFGQLRELNSSERKTQKKTNDFRIHFSAYQA
jgi:hypothetical protein